mgnify:CR=1 FL=1
MTEREVFHAARVAPNTPGLICLSYEEEAAIEAIVGTDAVGDNGVRLYSPRTDNRGRRAAVYSRVPGVSQEAYDYAAR